MEIVYYITSFVVDVISDILRIITFPIRVLRNKRKKKGGL